MSGVHLHRKGGFQKKKVAYREGWSGVHLDLHGNRKVSEKIDSKRGSLISVWSFVGGSTVQLITQNTLKLITQPSEDATNQQHDKGNSSQQNAPPQRLFGVWRTK